MRTHRHHRLPPGVIALVIAGTLAVTAGAGFALAMSGEGDLIFLLIAAAIVVTGWAEARHSA